MCLKDLNVSYRESIHIYIFISAFLVIHKFVYLQIANNK